MKIVCVAGGSYKSFYLNYFLHLRKCDLLIFNFGIIYDYYINDGNRVKIIKKELSDLATKLNCTVLAGIYVVNKSRKKKSILLLNHKRFKINSVKKGVELSIGKKMFIAGGINTDYNNKNKIIFTNKRIIPNIKRCNSRKIYIFCDCLGVSFVKDKKLQRNFNKYSKIILK